MNIYDIAQRCGVSIATVSRVLNQSPRVSDKTRRHVLEVIAAAGYTPNVFARGLGLNTMKMIGILCVDISDLFFAKAVSLVEQMLRENGFNVVLTCTGPGLENKKKGIELLLQKSVDAIILIGSSFKEASDHSHISAAAVQVPVVLIGGYIDLMGVYCVLCDEQEGMVRNVRMLCAKGHRRILYVYDSLTYNGKQKLDGYTAALTAQGIHCDDRLIVKEARDVEQVAARIGALLDAGINFTAAVASEDLMAVGVQKAVAQRGLACDLIGFNNSIFAQVATPALTSVDNMLDTLCPTAVQHLVAILEGSAVPQKLVVSSRLVVRQTFIPD